MSDTPYILPLDRIDFRELDFGITVAEVGKHLPFTVQRVYWLTSAGQDVLRGNHAHMNSEQVLVALQGKMDVKITDRSGGEQRFMLGPANGALYVPSAHWLNIHMPAGAILLCLSSKLFGEQQTVYDFNDFMQNV